VRRIYGCDHRERIPVAVDDDAREDYWITIRRSTSMTKESMANR
jgi:hypothetical protein